MRLTNLKDKKILILGLGREGVDTFKFLRKIFPKKELGIGDRLELRSLKSEVRSLIEKDERVKPHLGENYLKALKDYDIIIKSPGIPAKILRKFRRASQIITSQTEIFFENCPGKIVGVTGTKGKSTTASLIYKILREGGIKAHLVGNIGKPVLNLLLHAKSATSLRPSGSARVCECAHANKPNDVYVYELSSHQLFGLKKSPQIAVFLNIYPEHGDYYQNFKEYLNAKANISRYQKKEDFLVYNSEDKIVKEIAKKSQAKKIPFDATKYEFITNIRNKIPLIGKFNLKNIMAAIAVGKIFGVSDRNIKRAIKKFKSLSHRLEFVGKYKGIEFYNDSLATIPEATIEAIDALGKNLQTIILGGFERGQDFKNLAKRILKSKIKTIILFPTTGERIWQALRLASLAQGKKLPRHFFVDNMKEAVKLAYQSIKRGKICLLSPASASFNLFKDYKERGNLFKKWVKIFAWAHSHTRA